MSTRFARTTRSLAHDGRRRVLPVWLVAGALLAAWLGWFLFGRVTIYEVSRHARMEVQQSAHTVAALVASRVVSSSMVLGREVQAGDLLVQLDAAPETLRLNEEEARLKALAPRIASLNKEIAALEEAALRERAAAKAAVEGALFRIREAEAAVAFARDNERRLKAESAAGGVAQIEATRAEAESVKLGAIRDGLKAENRRLDTEAQARALHQQAQVESLRRAALALEGDMSTSRATIARLHEEISRLAVRAPVGGTIAELVPLGAGAYVAQGQKLATVVPHGDLMIVADFTPASVLGRIRAGQSAQLRLDGFPWAQYGSLEATVTRVAGEVRDGMVRVEFAPDGDASPRVALQHGLPGSIEVGIEQVSPAQLVLRAAGRFDDPPVPAPQGPGHDVAAQ